jgi:hypothetical protein
MIIGDADIEGGDEGSALLLGYSSGVDDCPQVLM